MLACPTGGVDQYFNGLLGINNIRDDILCPLQQSTVCVDPKPHVSERANGLAADDG